MDPLLIVDVELSWGLGDSEELLSVFVGIRREVWLWAGHC